MSVGAVGSTPYFPITSPSKQPVANNQQSVQQQPTQPVQSVATDADGDNDGSKGRNIDTYA